MLIRWIVSIGCVSAAAFGLYGCVHSLHGILLGRETAEWPSASARLETCKLDTWTDEGSTTFHLNVQYSFSVKEKEYVATGIHPAVGAGEELRLLYEKLNGHRIVQVRYNPSDPSEAYLIAGSFSKHWGALFGSLTAVVFSLLFMLTATCAMTTGSLQKRLVIIR